jgi:hypothetical protein
MESMWLKGCESHKFSGGKECLEKNEPIGRNGADNFAQTPPSPENVADKTFMLISRDTITQNRLS